MKNAAEHCASPHYNACRPCKPSSVLRRAEPLSFIYNCDLSQLPATYPSTSDEQPLAVDIHGLATRKAYSRRTLLPPRWALTPPFHPYLLRGGHSLLRYYTLTDIKSLACVALCVARTFLPRLAAAAIERVCTVQIYAFFLIPPRCGRKPGRAQACRSLYRDCSGFMSFTRSCVLTVPR